MMNRPRIAIPIPTSIDPEYNLRSWKNYADAVVDAGGEAVKVDPQSEASVLRTLAASCAGVLLPGSPADVDPGRYGDERQPNCGPADAAREGTDWTLLDDAERGRKPVLGICYGIQSMTAWSGGTLVQDLAPVPVNHAAGGKVAVAHSVLIAPNSLLGRVVQGAGDVAVDGQFLRLPVNSSHHQAVAIPGDNFRLTARCPEDGVLEAIEWSRSGADDWWVLGVQWHPERSRDLSAASRAIFAALIDEASRSEHAPAAVQALSR